MRGGPEEGGKDWLPLALWESALFVMETRLRRSLKQAWSYSKRNSEFCLCQYLVFVCLLDLSILPATFTRKPAPGGQQKILYWDAHGTEGRVASSP